mmetsp:Transcript_115267/g.200635  ORF Transcript_115267/g.200635 Transcript_115267/m.200635 type:complete len:360 (+) Transcript_115267:1270-2349(+)
MEPKETFGKLWGSLSMVSQISVSADCSGGSPGPAPPALGASSSSAGCTFPSIWRALRYTFNRSATASSASPYMMDISLWNCRLQTSSRFLATSSAAGNASAGGATPSSITPLSVTWTAANASRHLSSRNWDRTRRNMRLRVARPSNRSTCFSRSSRSARHCFWSASRGMEWSSCHHSRTALSCSSAKASLAKVRAVCNRLSSANSGCRRVISLSSTRPSSSWTFWFSWTCRCCITARPCRYSASSRSVTGRQRFRVSSSVSSTTGSARSSDPPPSAEGGRNQLVWKRSANCSAYCSRYCAPCSRRARAVSSVGFPGAVDLMAWCHRSRTAALGGSYGLSLSASVKLMRSLTDWASIPLP